MKIPGFPIWGMEFGADYPFEGKAPIKLRKADLEEKKGTFGKKTKGNSLDDVLQSIEELTELPPTIACKKYKLAA